MPRLHLDKGKLSDAVFRPFDTENITAYVRTFFNWPFIFNRMGNKDFSLAAMGSREQFMAGELLIARSSNAWASSDDHLEDDVKLEFNPTSGNVYLVDKDYNVVMLNGDDKLENWLYCGDCGTEGFRSEVRFAENSLCSHCATKVAWGQENVLELECTP